MGRVYSIDFLRGVMASLVMIYHFNSWSGDGLDASSILSRFGLYAVSIFYIISGYALAYVYSDKGSSVDILKYSSARFFRLAPLFYLVSTAFLIKAIIVNDDISFINIVLNFSFLFSVVDPSAYLATGAWSIGNEMLFYCVLLIVLKSPKYELALFVLLVLSIISFVLFRFQILNIDASLPSQWGLYINPLNHILFFVTGLCFYQYRHFIARYTGILLTCTLMLSSLIFLYPAEGGRINLVTGLTSFLLFLSSVSIFLVFLILNRFSLFSFLPFRFMGDISYSLYLLHPLVWFVVARILPSNFNAVVIIILAVIVTVILSWVSFKYFEKPAINFGKRYIKHVRPS
jgi:exopolysaccharide production protein ExoZ